MTAFDNIKVNNWPATSNDLEDFLVLKLPLNDTASLSESLPVNAGSQELFPKRTLTNSNVKAKRAGVSITDAGTITGSPYDANHAMEFAFRDGYDTYGQPATSQSAAFASSGGTYKIVFADGGYSVSQNIVLKFYINGGNIKVNAGETDEQEFTSSDGSGFQTWTIAASSVSQLKNVQLTNSSNTGPYWSGIYVDGVQLANPPGGSKKHYDNNADFGTSSEDTYLTIPASSDFSFGTAPWCIECWAYIRSTPTNGTAIWDFDTGSGYTSEEWISSYTQGGVVWFYCGHSGYDGINATYTANQWQHWAWTWDGTTARLFRDGTVAASTTTTNKSAGWGSATRNITIGKQNYDSPNRFGDQQIQDLRFYKGIAKYTANFTPQVAILG